MNDNARPTAVSGEATGSTLFAILGGFACVFAGMGLAFLLGEATGLRQRFLEIDPKVDVLMLFPLALSYVVICEARSAVWPRWGLFVLTVTVQSSLYYLAIAAAGAIQVLVTPERGFLVPLLVFVLLSWPVAATGYLALRREGIRFTPEAPHGGLMPWLVATAPGIVVSGLVLDIVDALWALPALLHPVSVTFALLLPVLAITKAVRAETVADWATVAILTMVAQVAAVIAGATLSMVAARFDPTGYSIAIIYGIAPWYVASVAVRAAKAIIGPGGPWRLAKSSEAERA